MQSLDPKVYNMVSILVHLIQANFFSLFDFPNEKIIGFKEERDYW